MQCLLWITSAATWTVQQTNFTNQPQLHALSFKTINMKQDSDLQSTAAWSYSYISQVYDNLIHMVTQTLYYSDSRGGNIFWLLHRSFRNNQSNSTKSSVTASSRPKLPRHLSICIRHLSVTLTIPLVENLNQYQAAIQTLHQHSSVQKNVP